MDSYIFIVYITFDITGIGNKNYRFHFNVK